MDRLLRLITAVVVLLTFVVVPVSVGLAALGATTCVSVSSAGVAANASSARPSVSGDGRYVAYESSADNLVSNDTNSQIDIFVRDRLLDETSRVSVAADGSEANGRSRQLVALTICADRIILSGAGITGTVTLVAGTIEINGIGMNLTAREHGVLVFATGQGTDVIEVNGIGQQLTGDLVARSGQIAIGGSLSRLAGSIAGWTVEVVGVGWRIGNQ